MTRYYSTLFCLVLFTGNLMAQETVQKHVPIHITRQPAYPLKTDRMLWTAEEVARARQRIKEDPAAEVILGKLKEKADFWVNQSDARVLELIPTAAVPRAANASIFGDPVHGTKIYEHGTYPWKLDRQRPYVVISPIDGKEYPSNDFAKGFKEGFTDEDREGQFFDDGWGWVDENGKRFWFAAYACHWHWYNEVLPGVLATSRMYLLTQDKRYAHVTALMLATIADQYPAMDYDKQSRFGTLTRTYDGKILNAIWETWTLRRFAESYDNVWDSIDDDLVLQQTLGKTGAQIRSLIEANLLEEGIDGVASGHIQGNFGMHQQALLMTLAARQHAPTREILEPIFTATGQRPMLEGLDYVMYNLVHRDGVSHEGAAGYNRMWSRNFFSMAVGLKRLGLGQMVNRQKLRDMALAPLKMIMLNMTTPAFGDSGSVSLGIVTPEKHVYLWGQAWFDQPALDWWVQREKANELTDYFQLFDPAPELKSVKQTDAPPYAMPTTRLLDGSGLAFLENDTHDWGVFFNYGYPGNHSHRDGLNFELFGYGRHLMPDQGYPDFRNSFIPGIFTWSENTIAHNCVMIDRTQQREKAPVSSQMLRQIQVDGLRMIEAEAAGVFYAQAETYRRALIMVDIGTTHGYVIDLTHVRGGQEHHYSLHGPPGQADTVGGTWSSIRPGTLAGEEVGVGELYDSPKMGHPDYKGTYNNYFGSGFSHFQHVRSLDSGDPTLIARHIKDPDVGIVIRILPERDQDFKEVLWAEAQISPLKQKDMLPYLIERRQCEDHELASRFVSVLEPFKSEPTITSVSRRDISGGVVVTVTYDTGYDVIFYRDQGTNELHDGGITTNGAVTLIRYADPNADRPTQVSLLGGDRFVLDGRVFAHGDSAAVQTQSPIHGQVTSIDPEHRTIEVALSSDADASTLVGRYPGFDDGGRIVRYPVINVQQDGRQAKITLDEELRIGRGRIASIEGNRIVSLTPLRFLQGIYSDAWLTDDSYASFTQVHHVDDTIVYLKESPSGHEFAVGEDFWLCTLRDDSSIHLEGASRWEIKPVELTP